MSTQSKSLAIWTLKSEESTTRLLITEASLAMSSLSNERSSKEHFKILFWIWFLISVAAWRLMRWIICSVPPGLSSLKEISELASWLIGPKTGSCACTLTLGPLRTTVEPETTSVIDGSLISSSVGKGLLNSISMKVWPVIPAKSTEPICTIWGKGIC